MLEITPIPGDELGGVRHSGRGDAKVVSRSAYLGRAPVPKQRLGARRVRQQTQAAESRYRLLKQLVGKIKGEACFARFSASNSFESPPQNFLDNDDRDSLFLNGYERRPR